MSKEKNTSSGIAAILVIVLVVVIVGLVVGVVYFSLSGKSTLPDLVSQPTTRTSTQESGAPDEELAPISDSDDIETIQAELKSTQEGSIDADFDSLEEETLGL
ncbi:MAG: hypothetical protein ACC618_02340 [Patescibacteria group bacterium]